MSKLTALTDFKKKFDIELEKYLNKAIKETAKNDSLMAETLRYIKKMMLAGGKRLRPALMYHGYLAAGGKEKKKILQATIGIELINTYFLIHDDIMDQDEKRHGMETIHLYYEKAGKKLIGKSDTKHFGNSMAIVAGDMINTLGNQAVCKSEFDLRVVVKALEKLQSIILTTIIGQSQDMIIEYRRQATEKEILKMYKNKTARYTVEGPLHLGAILAGANNSFLKKLSNYAIPAGIAFQIQDDTLGVIGDEEKTGKSVGSDIRQGKYTILVAKAFEKSDAKQKNILKNTLGKKNLTKKDLENFRNIIKETGSLDYAKELSLKLVLKAKKELAGIKMNKEAKIFLNDIADYMIQREL